jgi:hypothetical protein
MNWRDRTEILKGKINQIISLTVSDIGYIRLQNRGTCMVADAVYKETKLFRSAGLSSRELLSKYYKSTPQEFWYSNTESNPFLMNQILVDLINRIEKNGNTVTIVEYWIDDDGTFSDEDEDDYDEDDDGWDEDD